MTPKSRNVRTLGLLSGIAIVMCLGAWASVPFYDWFCRVTGFGGTTAQAAAGPEQSGRAISVRFDASRERGMPWQFRPLEREMELKVGESALAFYEAYNPTGQAVAGAASYNVYPFTAGGYFVKVDCFCFEEQVLEPGERVSMPVSFYVDPEIDNDPEARLIESITLSYTFHRIDLPEGEQLRAGGESLPTASILESQDS